MSEFAEIIENIENMPFESQEIIVDIINKRFSETKRNIFINETLKSKDEYVNGNYSEGSSEELFNILKI